MRWKRCCAASARSSLRFKRHSNRSPAPMHTSTITMAMSPKLRGKQAAHIAGAKNLEPAALYRLMSWFSASYPIGAFSYSSGIEWAVAAGDIGDATTLQSWLAVLIGGGGGFLGAGFFANAH